MAQWWEAGEPVDTIINQTPAEQLLAAIKTVDGSGSGLDADLLDGAEGSDMSEASAISVTPTGTLVATDVQAAIAEIIARLDA